MSWRSASVEIGRGDVPAAAGVHAAGNAPPAFANAPRVQEALTAPLERKILAWLAQRLPMWINSDHLTGLGFAAQFLAGMSYAFAGRVRAMVLLATFFIALNWFGDSLDGTVARLRNRQRPRYGFYVDHVIDTFGAAFLMGGLAISGFLHWQVAAGLLVAFLVLSIEVYLATYTLGNFQLSYWKFGPTEIRIVLMIGNIVLFFRPTVHALGGRYLLFDVGGVVAIAVMLGITLLSVVRHTTALYRLERLP